MIQSLQPKQQELLEHSLQSPSRSMFFVVPGLRIIRVLIQAQPSAQRLINGKPDEPENLEGSMAKVLHNKHRYAQAGKSQNTHRMFEQTASKDCL